MDFLEQARQLALRGLGRTAPNPIVGAVVIRDGEIVGTGFHAGNEHAEVLALREAGSRALGATLYCTLEPCKHVGRTGPCTDAITAAGVARVVYASADPTSLAGGGSQILRSRGVDVIHDPRDDIDFDNRAWLHKVRTGHPYFIAKTAMSIDGRIAAFDGSSKWISNDLSRQDVMGLRGSVDAIVTGTGTVLADDPLLTVRNDMRVEQPTRVVVGDREIPSHFRIHQDHGFAQVPTVDDTLKMAIDAGWNSVLVEAGSQLTSAFFERDLIDEWWLYLAPILLGTGTPAIGDIAVTTLAQAKQFTLVTSSAMGGDLRLIYQKGSDVHGNS